MTDNCLQICSVFIQGLEGYFRDPQFDQTTVRDSGKRKISCPGGGGSAYERGGDARPKL